MKVVRGKIVSYALAIVLGVSTVGMPITAAAQEEQRHYDKSTRMMGDIFFVRPFALIGTVLGAATFVVALPFSAAGGNTGEAWDHLVVAPASSAFGRPLGEMPECRSSERPSGCQR